ncbi:glycoside hydrolase family 6 protein [Nonomuraea sp. NPDC059023]|uniref:glycoside hydrolase family 6 protein n=1 Tax=unclassified Nonomuraea TaxID=2593643 RepID=UPI003673A6D5
MRFIAAKAAVALTAVAAALLTAPTPASAAAQLVANGGFGGGVAGWKQIDQAEVTADAGRMKVRAKTRVNDPWNAMTAANTTATLKPGRTYTLSFDAQGSEAFTPATTVQYLKTPGQNQSLGTTFPVTTTSKRFLYTFTAKAPADASDLTVEVTFQVGSKDRAATVWFDNVSLMETQATRPTGLFVSGESNPAVWVRNNWDAQRAKAEAINNGIATKPIFMWFGGWFGDLTKAVDDYVGAAQAADKLPMLVAYNIPYRDACATHSNGGAADAAAYHAWITAFARAIGSRHAVVILEPDAVAAAPCVTQVGGDPEDQYRILLDATQVLKAAAPNAWVYLDAGNSGWVTNKNDLVTRLGKAGIANTRGFSLNVSNYKWTDQTTTYGTDVKNLLAPAHGNKPFVIDTSRNGNGPYPGDSTPEDDWCNPPNRKLGAAPAKPASGAEYHYWVKVPGDSDGRCGIAPTTPAGQFSPDLAMALINGNP